MVGECNAETTAGLVVLYQGQVSLISLAQFSSQIKAESRPTLVGCEKRFKNRHAVLRSDARAEIANIHVGALAIGGHFEKYMDVTMSMLQQASATEVDMEDDDLVDYLHQLQEGIFEAYTGVLLSLIHI